MTTTWKLFAILLLGAVWPSLVHAQSGVQWATEVIEFTSEYSPREYSAAQVLGKPDVLPGGGDNPGAWSPESRGKYEQIVVGFASPMRPTQIMIGESYNPSAVAAVYLIDLRDEEHLVHQFSPGPSDQKARMLNIFIDQPDFQVNAIRLVLDMAAIPGFVGIDAIGMATTRIPIQADVQEAQIVSSTQITRLPETVNSLYPERGPIISPDGSEMYFSRQFHPDNVGGEEDYEDIYISKRDPDTGEWMLAENAGTDLNNAGPNFVSSITPDGKSVMVVLGNRYEGKDGQRMEQGVSFSTRSASGEWTDPQGIDIKDFYNYHPRGDFFMAQNRKVMFMSADRDDSRGVRDIYVSFLEEDSSWTAPLNIGDVINTVGDDYSPFLAADDETLYFASNGHPGFGGADIFVSKRLDDTYTNWSEPKNLGPDVNSLYEDCYFNIPLTGNKAFYCRGENVDDENNFINLDLYTVPIPEFYKPNPIVIVSGVVRDKSTGEPVAAKIIYERLSDGKEMGIAVSDPETGEYEIALPYGEQYGFLAEADDFASVSSNVDLREQAGAVALTQDLTLVPIRANEVVLLNNIFFDFDKAELKPESYPELDRLIKLTEKYPTMRIEIGGHTDDVGRAEYNQDLSERRAKAVAKYLTKNGLSNKRMNVVGYGESKPTVDNDTEENRALNRRVEFTILEK